MLNDDDDQVQPNQNVRMLQLENEFLRYNLDILGVSEARWLSSGTVKTPFSNTVFLYSGKDDAADKPASVGFLMTPRAHSCLISWEPISERLITARCRSKVRNITLIQCYGPTEKSSVNAKDDFYNLLAATYNKAPHGDTIVMGDLNAKVGADRTTLEHVLGNQDIGLCNDNGERFVHTSLELDRLGR